ncbi:AI-2E family transporter [Pedobacter immunditicola]|uniref:AI-2E family transporter n=1 Tax=Pedobacter immunditicola TaxID=3133440 RepID=UPI0030AB9B1E
MDGNQKFSATYLSYTLMVLATVILMYLGRILFIPLSFGLLIALVLYPFCVWLEAHKCPRGIAIFISLSLLIVLFVGVIWILVWQLNFLKNEIPTLTDRFQNASQHLQEWFHTNIGSPLRLDKDWLQDAAKRSLGSTNWLIQKVAEGLGSSLFTLFIIPVFTALFLFHRQQFVAFIKSLFSEDQQGSLHRILHEVCYIYHKYIIGLLKVYIIVGILNSIGLLILGIEHAILFGMLTAFMTMVPYVGIIISSLLPISVAWITTGTLFYPLAVVGIFTFVQYLENSIIFPKVVGVELNVSSWAILVALIAGGIVWGMAGMILFMPFIAILKIISEHVPEWKPLNILLSRRVRKNRT